MKLILENWRQYLNESKDVSDKLFLVAIFCMTFGLLNIFLSTMTTQAGLPPSKLSEKIVKKKL